jgi:hypothetical protein
MYNMEPAIVINLMWMIFDIRMWPALNQRHNHGLIHVHRFVSIKWFVFLILGKRRDLIQLIKSIQFVPVIQMTRIIETPEIVEMRLTWQIELAISKWMEFNWTQVQDIEWHVTWPNLGSAWILQSNEFSSWLCRDTFISVLSFNIAVASSQPGHHHYHSVRHPYFRVYAMIFSSRQCYSTQCNTRQFRSDQCDSVQYCLDHFTASQLGPVQFDSMIFHLIISKYSAYHELILHFITVYPITLDSIAYRGIIYSVIHSDSSETKSNEIDHCNWTETE